MKNKKIKLTFSQDLSACLCHFQECLESRLRCRQGILSRVEQPSCISHVIHSFYLVGQCNLIEEARILVGSSGISFRFLQVCAPKSLSDLHLPCFTLDQQFDNLI